MLEEAYKNVSLSNNFTFDESQSKLINILQQYKEAIESEQKSRIARLFKPSRQKKSNGMYIWGEVGRGKSMLINLFYDSVRTDKKCRIHFHEFMLDVHKKLDKMRKDDVGHKSKKLDFIKSLATDIAQKYKIICLDELQINNVADAMLAVRLFKILSELGVKIFFSSNFYPDDLFKDGLQRERFLPFIEHLKQNFEVFNLDNYHDYRLKNLYNIESVYLTSLSESTTKVLEKIVLDLTGHTKLKEKDIEIDHNRTLKCLNTYGRIAVFTFNELCAIPLGAIDYIALCNNFSTIVVQNIPKLNEDNYNEALRFITLIDCLYDTKTKLICSADSDPSHLYTGSKFAFEFKRTVSRLQEMQTSEYLNRNYL